MTVIGLYLIPEVLILYRDKLYRGNRAISYDSNGLNGNL